MRDVRLGKDGVEKRALDLVRLYVASFAVWTLAVQWKSNPGSENERRRLWLLCLENGWGQAGVAAAFELLVEWWKDQQEVGAKEYYCDVFNELRSFADKNGEQLVVAFDEIGKTASIAPGVWKHLDDYVKNRQDDVDAVDRRKRDVSGQFHECGSGNPQPADLLYALRLLMLELSGLRIVAAFADTNYSLTVLRDLGERSPINKRLHTVDAFQAATEADMCGLLSTYFGIEAPTGSLEQFRGRPAFFARNVLSALFAERDGDFDGWLARAITEARRICGEDVKELFMKTARRNLAIYSTCVGQLQCAAVFTPADERSSRSSIVDSANGDFLRSTSIVFATGSAAEYSVTTEPIMFDALRTQAYKAAPDKDLVLGHLASDLVNNKGHLFEDITAWMLVRHARLVREGKPQNTPVLLSAVLAPFLPPNFAFPVALAYTTVTIDTLMNLEKDDPFVKAVENPNAVCCRVSTMAHADIVFAAKVDGEDGIVAMQCKAWKRAAPISTCLASVASGCQYLVSSGKEKNYAKALADGGVELSFAANARAAFESTLRAHSTLEDNWIRVVTAVQPPDKRLLGLVETHNEGAAAAREAIVLLCATEAAHGRAARELSRLCPDGRAHASRGNSEWANDVKHWTVADVNAEVTRRQLSRMSTSSAVAASSPRP